MSSSAEVYIGPDGRLTGVWVTLDVNGEAVHLDFKGEECRMLVLFPDVADTVEGEFVPVDAVGIPEGVDGE